MLKYKAFFIWWRNIGRNICMGATMLTNLINEQNKIMGWNTGCFHNRFIRSEIHDTTCKPKFHHTWNFFEFLKIFFFIFLVNIIHLVFYQQVQSNTERQVVGTKFLRGGKYHLYMNFPLIKGDEISWKILSYNCPQCYHQLWSYENLIQETQYTIGLN